MAEENPGDRGTHDASGCGGELLLEPPTLPALGILPLAWGPDFFASTGDELWPEPPFCSLDPPMIGLPAHFPGTRQTATIQQPYYYDLGLPGEPTSYAADPVPLLCYPQQRPCPGLSATDSAQSASEDTTLLSAIFPPQGSGSPFDFTNIETLHHISSYEFLPDTSPSHLQLESSEPTTAVTCAVPPQRAVEFKLESPGHQS